MRHRRLRRAAAGEPPSLEGLKRLEYRGYDSAGIATLSNGGFTIHRTPGKLGNLVEKLNGSARAGRHGHRPHALGDARASDRGRTPTRRPTAPARSSSSTTGSSRTSPSARSSSRRRGHTLQERDRHRGLRARGRGRVRRRPSRRGARGGAAADRRVRRPRRRRAASRACSSPRARGRRSCSGSGRARTSSPRTRWRSCPGPATSSSSRTATWPAWTRRASRVVNAEGDRLERPVHRILWDAVAAEKGGYRHFMAKEIHEQPTAIAETLGGKVSLETGELYLDSPLLSPERVAKFDRVLLLACGTSWHAGQVGKFLIEGMARIPVEVDYGSEFRYRRPGRQRPDADDRDLAVRRDGRHRGRPARRRGARARRSPRSSTCREARSRGWPTPSSRRTPGPEIGVASTKAFTTQLAVLYLHRREAARVARPRAASSRRRSGRRSRTCPGPSARALALEPELEELARRYQHAQRLPLPRPRPALSRGARGRAEAEGDLLHPRRGLPGGRDEARPDRADRREHAGHRARAPRRVAREDALEPARGQVARRHRDRVRHAARRGGRRRSRTTS